MNNRILCTIANRRYMPYLQRWIYSARESGWRGRIVVLTGDKSLKANAEIRHTKQEFKTAVFKDNRWLKLELDRYFDDGEHVAFFDVDIVFFKSMPWDEIFKYELGLTTVPLHHDVTKEMPLVKEITGVEPHTKYLASPCIFVKNKRSIEFFENWRSYRELSEQYKKGTMFALNLACYSMGPEDIYIFPEDRCAYTLTVRFKEKVKDPYLFHYGGGQGKQIWHDEYMKGKVYDYRR